MYLKAHWVTLVCCDGNGRTAGCTRWGRGRCSCPQFTDNENRCAIMALKLPIVYYFCVQGCECPMRQLNGGVLGV